MICGHLNLATAQQLYAIWLDSAAAIAPFGHNMAAESYVAHSPTNTLLKILLPKTEKLIDVLRWPEGDKHIVTAGCTEPPLVPGWNQLLWPGGEHKHADTGETGFAFLSHNQVAIAQFSSAVKVPSLTTSFPLGFQISQFR